MPEANIITLKRFRSNKRLIKLLLYIAIVLLFFSLIYILIFPLFKADKEKKPFSFLNVDGYWADSVFNFLTIEEKLHQLLIIKEDFLNYDTTSVLNTPYSGYLFKHDSIKKFRDFDQFRNQLSKPLFMSISYIDSIKDFPVMLPPEGIYSIRDDSLVERYMLNHLEKVLYSRSNMAIFPLKAGGFYSEEKPDTMILRRKSNYFSYFQTEAIKHGIIPVLPVSLRALSTIPLTNRTDTIINDYFGRLINPGLPAIIVDTVPEPLNKPEGLRKYLYEKYGFTGLIIFEKDRISSEDFFNLTKSGVDMIVSNRAPKSVIQKIVVESTADRKKTKYLDKACLKVLYLKEWLLGNKEQQKDHSFSTLNSTLLKQLYIKLEGSSIIRLRDHDNIIPLSTKAGITYTLHLPVGTDFNTFTEHFGYFADYNTIRYSHIKNLRPSRASINIIYITDLVKEEYLIDFEKRFYSSGFNEAQVLFINTGDIERLKKLQFLPALIHVHRNTIYSQRIVANFLFGGASCSGIIPWDILPKISSGEGLISGSAIRFNYTIPEEAGINSNSLKHIDSIIQEAIVNAVFPGCQVFISVKGDVIFHRSFGQTAYEDGANVKWDHLYDIASLTKVAATTPAFMKMYENGHMRLNDTLGKFFKDRSIVSTDKNRDITNESVSSNNRAGMVESIFGITMQEFLEHKSGLAASLPINRFLTRRHIPSRARSRFNEYFSPIYIEDSATIVVAEKIFFYNHYFDTLWHNTKAMHIKRSKDYLYSDANMILLQMAIDSVNDLPLDQFCDNTFYKPLGLRHFTFKPTEQFAIGKVVPTANDLRWRTQLVHGYVHDPTAALFGGIAGNAGLFSNANDLGIFSQMLLQGGVYGGDTLLTKETVSLFTSRSRGSSRGLGFDLKYRTNSTAGWSVPPETYGHTGFTGTCVWIDPENEIVYVFLSNRIHPNTENHKINFFKVREKIHEVIYDAMRYSQQQ